MDAAAHDEKAIRDLIESQAAQLSWSAQRAANWLGFADGFAAGAPMIASARPARLQSVAQFVERMKDLAGGSLRTFGERVLGGRILIFGNVAVALFAGETRENETEINRDVSGYLLIKDQGRWRIAAQAWDKERPGHPIPKAMLEPG